MPVLRPWNGGPIISLPPSRTNNHSRRLPGERHFQLTRTEEEILQLSLEGLSISEIAERRGTSYKAAQEPLRIAKDKIHSETYTPEETT